jgi:hypothetical protein
MAKAKKSKAKKSKTKKTKKAKKSTGRAAAASRGKAKKSKARGAKKTARKAAKPKARAKKAAPRKKKQTVGEGDYQASRSFLKDEANFVKRHASDIPAMGRNAEAALEGPEGGQLRAAEEEARSHSKAPGE